MMRAVHTSVVRLVPVLWLAFSMAPLRSATLERLSLNDMIGKSTAIVRGRAGGSSAASHGSLIYTHVRVQVLERWKGPDTPFIEVVIPGGVTGKIRQSFSGVPQLMEGKEYLLFLWTGKSGDTQVIGLSQGVFELPKNLNGESMAVRSAATETMLEPGTGLVVKDERIEMKLRDLSARIAGTLTQGAAK